jgi:hypothetical protein
MGQDERQPAAFEAAAEEELQRIRGALEESRLRRRQLNEAFDSFVRSFREAPQERRPQAPVVRSLPREPRAKEPEAAILPSAAARPVPYTGDYGFPSESEAGSAPPQPARALAPQPARAPRRDSMPDTRNAGPTAAAPATAGTSPPDSQRGHAGSDAPVPIEAEHAPIVPAALRSEKPRVERSRIGRVAGMALLVAAAGLFAWRVRSPEPSQVAVAPAVGEPSLPQAPPPAPAASSPQADPSAAQRLTGQLTTVRPVWVRVLVDGERTIERELPSGRSIPLSARQTIAIRAGDAGAVRVTIDGKDHGPLGPDGAVANRTFTKPR